MYVSECETNVPREWDATSYDALPLPHVRWGGRTIDRLRLSGDETVLDAGCGTGRDAQLLLERLPSGRVVAVDASARMLGRLRERLAGDLARMDVVRADLTGAVPLAEAVGEVASLPVDAVVSVAAFHWIADHQTLFANLSAVLRPGGQFSVDCGGAGNIAAVRRAIDDVLGAQPSPWNFATAEDTRKRLLAAGFEPEGVRLRPDPARFPDGAQLRDYLRTVVLGAHLDAMPEADREGFVTAVGERLPEPVVDYVRLEFTATLAG